MQIIELHIPPAPLLVTIGHTIWQPGMIHFERKHQVFDLLFCVNGSMYMEEEGNRYHVTSGMSLLLEPNKSHVGYRKTEIPTEIYWIHFVYDDRYLTIDEQQMNETQAVLTGDDFALVAQTANVYLPKFTTIDLKALLPLLEKMTVIQSSLIRKNSYEIHLLLGQILVELQNSMYQQMKSDTYKVSEAACLFIERTILEPFQSSYIEQSLHYQFDYITRCMKKHIGMTPLQYRHHVQVEQAKHLLQHTELTVKEIAMACGVVDANYFNRLFKKMTSYTPGQYRKRFNL